MKLLLRCCTLLPTLLLASNGFTQSLPEGKKAAIEKFVNLVQTENWAGLAETVKYPLDREYPLPDIESEAEFIVRHTEVFDDSLTKMISNSLSDSSAWTLSENKGLVLRNGAIGLDSLGALTAINYESENSRTLKEQLIEDDRKSLPISMQEYERPILQMKTEKFLVRIDETKGPSYRMIVWIQGNRNPNVPAINEIPYGVLTHYGKSGNYAYSFKSDYGKFVCFMSKSKDDGTLPADLLLYRNNELVRAYPSIWLKN